jgi:gamma-glutamylcyclotransferase
MKFYFAYGANLSREGMAYRCPDATPYQKFTLRGWRLDFAHHATIVPHPGRSVEGALWKITEDCERSLDQFEGYPSYYSKRILAQDGREFMVYIMNPPLAGSPGVGYLDIIEQGYRDWNLDFDCLDRAVDQLNINPYNTLYAETSATNIETTY